MNQLKLNILRVLIALITFTLISCRMINSSDIFVEPASNLIG